MEILKIDKSKLVNLEYSLSREVLRTNRAGAYACSTITFCNTRKYHGLLVSPIADYNYQKFVLLSTVHETIVQQEKAFNLGMHKYAGDNYEPKGHKYLRDFISNPIPRLVYRVGGVVFSKEIVLTENEDRMIIKYTLEEAHSETKLVLKPFLAYRHIHQLSKANMDLNTHFTKAEKGIVSKPYHGLPALYMQLNKESEYIPAPDWYYNIEYAEEQKRGYDYKEDLFVPGYFEIPVKKGESVYFAAGLSEIKSTLLKSLFDKEVKKRVPRDTQLNCLKNTATQFFETYDKDIFMTAGFPWLPVRSRDICIALPGINTVSKEKKTYKKVLKSLIKTMNGNLMPVYPMDKENPIYSADTSLWFIWCVQQLAAIDPKLDVQKEFGTPIRKIINGYLKEKNVFFIDNDGLIVQKEKAGLSWMDAKTETQAVTPRLGKTVENSSLWYNALCYAVQMQKESKKAVPVMWGKMVSLVKESFVSVFVNKGYPELNDFVSEKETNHQIRPNQLIAISMPFSPLSKDQKKRAFDTVKQHLLTAKGIRTLAPSDPDFVPVYQGDHNSREQAAHQGAVYPWLLQFYAQVLFLISPNSAAKTLERLLKGFDEELSQNGLCSISELYDANPPHLPGGAISHAMNLSALLYIKNKLE
jgi:predicted glycogen debranching enzyme